MTGPGDVSCRRSTAAFCVTSSPHSLSRPRKCGPKTSLWLATMRRWTRRRMPPARLNSELASRGHHRGSQRPTRAAYASYSAPKTRRRCGSS